METTHYYRRRQSLGAFGLVLIAVSLAYLATLGHVPEKRPRLVAAPELLDFGEVRRQTLDGEFTLTNQSETPIQILHVLLSCACESVEVPRKRLEPGESVKARFTWDARRNQGESRNHFSVAYKVPDEDGVRYAHCIWRGNVAIPVEWEPTEVRFSLSQKEVQTDTIHFWSSEQDSLSITEATCIHPALSAAADPETNEVTVSFDPSRWHPGDEHAAHQVRVRTGSDPPVVSLPVRFRN